MKNVSVDFKKKFILGASPGHMYLTILPTEKCNFRCTYCYEDFEIGKMSDDTVEGIKNLLTKSAPTLKNLKIAWFGGEPTLNQKAVLEISQHIKTLQAEYQFIYSAFMTTNSYLLDAKMFDDFINVGISGYQITLDGDKDCHDTTRLQLNGKGSFDVIWGNLLTYKQSAQPFQVILRLHITAQNTESMWVLCQKIKTEFGDDNRFSTQIEEIKNLGDGAESSNASAYVAANAKQRVTDIKTLMSKTLAKQENNDSEVTNPYICYAAMPRQLMIRADGSIGKCTVLLNDDRNNLGKINRNGDYQLDGKKFEIWTRGFVSLNEAEIGCPVRQLPKLEKAEKFTREINIVEVA